MLRCRQLKRVASLAECMCPSHLVCAARHSAAGCCSQITVSGRRLTAPAISPASRLGPFSAPAAEPFAAAAANSRAQTPLLLLCQPLAQDIVICKSFTSCSTGSKLQALGSDQSQFRYVDLGILLPSNGSQHHMCYLQSKARQGV